MCVHSCLVMQWFGDWSDGWLVLSECTFVCALFFFFFKQKTAYEMRISDWSSDVCSSDLMRPGCRPAFGLDVVEGVSPIDAGLALPQQVEVRSVQDPERLSLGHADLPQQELVKAG